MSAEVEAVPPEEPQPTEGPQTEQEASYEVLQMHQQFIGPLPPPWILEHYKAIDPDFPHVILEQFGQQGAHRRQMERTFMLGSERRANIGQILGTIVILSGIAGGVWITLDGQAIAGVPMFTLSLAAGGLSYVFGDFKPGKSKKDD